MNSNTSQPAMPPGGISPYYGYLPNADAAIAFITLFSLSTVAHTVQAFYPKKSLWALWSLCACGVIETVAWGGQLWSHDEPMNLTPFILQSTLTTTGPAFLFGAINGAFSLVIKILGAQYSHLSVKWSGLFFLLGDNAALMLQTIGGALGSSHSASVVQVGSKLKTAGVVLQNVQMGIFVLFVVEILVRYATNTPARQRVDMSVDGLNFPAPPKSRTHLMAGAVLLASLCLLARTIYRTAKTVEGSTSPLEYNQSAYDLFEGGAVAAALITLNLCHPGNILRPSASMYGQTKDIALQNRLGETSHDAASSGSLTKLPLIRDSASEQYAYPNSYADANV